ncbi:MAG: hypothetical protein GY749_10610 [Desulfobacteraceae bacterium]|nr:hypothetical protein [Desulfobacteraceae bacterium]
MNRFISSRVAGVKSRSDIVEENITRESGEPGFFKKPGFCESGFCESGF